MVLSYVEHKVVIQTRYKINMLLQVLCRTLKTIPCCNHCFLSKTYHFQDTALLNLHSIFDVLKMGNLWFSSTSLVKYFTFYDVHRKFIGQVPNKLHSPHQNFDISLSQNPYFHNFKVMISVFLKKKILLSTNIYK